MSWKRGPCPQGGGHLAGGRVQETNSYRVRPCNVVTWWPGKGSQLLLTNQWKKIDTEWRPDPKQLPPPGFTVTCPQGSASPGPLSASCGLGTESQKTTCASHIRKLLLSQSSASIRGNRGTVRCQLLVAFVLPSHSLGPHLWPWWQTLPFQLFAHCGQQLCLFLERSQRGNGFALASVYSTV